MEPLSLEQLKGNAGPGEGIAGGDDFLAKINSIITGINTLFQNYQRLKGNVNAQSQVAPKGGNADIAPGQENVLKIVDQRLLHLVAQTFSNKALNIPLNELIHDYGDLSVVQAMEKAAKRGEK